MFFQTKKYFYVLHKTQTVKLVKSARKKLKRSCFYIHTNNILRDVKSDEILKNSFSFAIFRQTKMWRLYIIIKKSKKILQKQVGLYYHCIIVFDDELSRNSKQKSWLRCWKSLFKVRLNVPLIKNFFQKPVDNSIGCVIIYSQTEHLFFARSVLLFWKSQEWFVWMLFVKMRGRVVLLSIVRILFALANGYC